MGHAVLESQDLPDEMVCVWNIAFIASDSRNWWRWLSPRWCRHVIAFGYVPATDSWVIIENGEERMAVLAIPDSAFAIWLDAFKQRDPVILRHTARNGTKHSHRFGNWCSTTVGRLTGVPGGAWRPLTLYRSLIRDGAKPVFGTQLNVIQGQRSEGRRGHEASA